MRSCHHALWRCVAFVLRVAVAAAAGCWMLDCLLLCGVGVHVFMCVCKMCVLGVCLWCVFTMCVHGVCVRGVCVDGVMGATVVLFVVFNKTTGAPITPSENDITFPKNTLRFPKAIVEPLQSHREPLLEIKASHSPHLVIARA